MSTKKAADEQSEYLERISERPPLSALTAACPHLPMDRCRQTGQADDTDGRLLAYLFHSISIKVYGRIAFLFFSISSEFTSKSARMSYQATFGALFIVIPTAFLV
ncbi:MAG: hypothetical protein FWG68_07180 [Defluviitaleaceae bacterium]|nr:hypothetical protein [Defluviitaleaceae bacterium]